MVDDRRDPGTRRTTPRPLLTSLALLTVGVVTLGAAMLVLPSIGAHPSSATPEVERAQSASPRQAPPFGSPPASPTEEATSVPGPRASNAIVSSAPPASSGSSASHVSGGTTTTIVAAGASGTPSITTTTNTTIDTATTSSTAATSNAIGGGPPVADASVATTGEAGIDLGDAGISGVPYVPPIVAAPVYGAPPSSTSTTGPVTYGATGDAAPLWSGGVSGGGSGNSAVVNPRPAVAVPFLLTMSDSDDPERAWTSLTPYLRPSDVVVASVVGNGTNDVAYQSFGDRVRTDAPLVQYVLALSDAKLKEMLAKGVPASVDAIGPARTDAVDAKSLVTLSSAVHAAGKKLFVSASIGSPVPLADLGARSEVIELVPSSSDATAAVTEATNAAAQIRRGGAPAIFVRLPSDAGSTTAASTFISALAGALPTAGVSIPYGASGTFLSDLRSSP